MVRHNNDVLFTCSEMSGLASQKPIMSKPKKKKRAGLSFHGKNMKWKHCSLLVMGESAQPVGHCRGESELKEKKKKKGEGLCTWQLLGVNVSVNILFYLSPECSIRGDAFKSNLDSWSMKWHSISQLEEERMFGSGVFNFCPFCEFLHTRLCWGGGIKLQSVTCTHVLTRSPPFWSRLRKITCYTRIFDDKMLHILLICVFISSRMQKSIVTVRQVAAADSGLGKSATICTFFFLFFSLP